MHEYFKTFVIRIAISICSILLLMLFPAWSDAMEWHETGPGGGGAVRDFAFDPDDPERVYLTSDMVGVFTSDDGGENWSWSSYGASSQKGGIALDPAKPNILYSVGPDGIYQSLDRAKSWHLVYSKGNGYKGVNNKTLGTLKRSIYGIPGQPIAIDEKGVVYVCTVVGDLIISRDRGKSWERISLGVKGQVMNVIPIDRNKVIAAIHDKGLFFSKDGGAAWKKGFSPESGRIMALAAHPDKNNVLYALFGTPANVNYVPKYSMKSFPADLYRSNDSGETWELVHAFNEIPLKKGRRIMDLSEDTIVILTTGAPIRSVDGGQTWEHSSLIVSEDDDYIYSTKGRWTSSKFSVYSDSRNEGRWYMTGMGAALQSNDRGKTWQYKVRGLHQDLYLFVKVNPHNPDIVIASDVDHGLIRSIDGGNTWKNIVIDNPYEECDELQFAPDDNTYKTLYAFFRFPKPYIAKSLDYGETWTILKSWSNKKKHSMARFSLTKGGSVPVMYTGEPQKGIWRSTDDGKSWELKNIGLPDPQDITYIQFIESDIRGHLYVGIKSKLNKKSGIYSSIDGGERWFPINRGLKSRSVRVGSFEIDPNNPDNLWVGSGRSVYMSTDCGNTWEERISDVLASSILVEPGNSDIVYVASFSGGGILEQYAAGIYKSLDGGDYFTNISGELFKTIGTSYRVYDLEYGWKASGMIWAAPYSGGLIYTAPQ